MFSIPAHALKSQIGNNYSYVIESEEMNKIKEVNSPMLAKVKSKPWQDMEIAASVIFSRQNDTHLAFFKSLHSTCIEMSYTI